ncbi:alpha-L-iduronidase-like [Ornithodoros turicata]|uniref:alpha-L-iduronidase-like n=1 Tax=Ornithodoros turicata TaxID=34597 RepID=UPI0031393513
MHQNLIYMASIPGRGLQQVRMHWLLDLVTANAAGTFNFTLLDELLDRLHTLGLHPGFELMGNPFGEAVNFEKREDVLRWKAMVTALASHYVDRYGEEYVARWNFESWNEPDHRGYGANFTLPGFRHYYDACSEGLRAVSTRLKLGGPAENLAPSRRAPLSRGLLGHCVRGRNYLTGERGVRLDFISIHQKGNASVSDIVKDEAAALGTVLNRFPSLGRKKCINDEADPLVSWSRPEAWRADATYAAMLARLVALKMKNASSCATMSSDNGFLSYPPHQFTQRTLAARFQLNHSDPVHSVLVRKPVHAVLGLLGNLGPVLLRTHLSGSSSSGHLDVIATRHRTGAFAVLVVLSNESTWEPGHGARVSVHLQPSPLGITWTAFHLDNGEATNPYALWLRQGCPPYPTRSQLAQMRNAQEPRKDVLTAPSLTLPSPSAALLVGCSAEHPLGPVPRGLRVHVVAPGRGILFWTPGPAQPCLEYDVLFAPDDGVPRVKLGGPVMFPVFFIDCEVLGRGCAGLLYVGTRSLRGDRGPISTPLRYKLL